MVDDIRTRGSELPEPKLKEVDQIVPSPDEEPAFVPPEEVEKPNLASQEGGFILTATEGPSSQKPSRLQVFKDRWNGLTKKRKIIVGVIAGVILLGLAGGVYALVKPDPKPAEPAPVVEQKKEEPPKTTEASKLTGVEIPIEVNKRPVTSIQIENSPDARPQAGLNLAGVVFEAIAEGGITRFNASFLEGQPEYIGPIRSVRPYYAGLVAPFDPIFVHAGGSGDGLAKLNDLGLKDLDHGANGGAFRRVSDRFAPHNLYSSMADLDKASQGRGYTASNVKSFARKADQAGQPVTARVIDLNISSPLYNVHYDYDPANNHYQRSMAGKPHTDHRSGAQITPRVVIALAMSFSQNGIYSVYQYNGTGAGVIYQDGIATPVTWKKASDKEQFEFVDATGQPVKINAGQTWITLVKDTGSITHAP